MTCRVPINGRDIFEVVKGGGFDDSTEESVKLRRFSSRSSAKIETLMSKLKQLWREDKMMKSTIFSQFTSFLDIIETALNRLDPPPL